MTNVGNIDNATTADSSPCKYKSSLLGGLNSRKFATNANPDIANAHRLSTNAKIAVPLKYLSNFFRSLVMPLINCRAHLELSWTKNCVVSTAGDNDNKTVFQITSTKLYVPIVTLSTKDNVNLTKQLNEGFKRSVYWNEYKSKIERKTADNNNARRFPLDVYFQGTNRLFALVFNNTDGNVNQVERNSHKKYLLPRVNITNYNV